MRVIDELDPGAVPGASTNKTWGRNRIDKRSKAYSFVRYCSTVKDRIITANDNSRGVALAA